MDPAKLGVFCMAVKGRVWYGEKKKFLRYQSVPRDCCIQQVCTTFHVVQYMCVCLLRYYIQSACQFPLFIVMFMVF